MMMEAERKEEIIWLLSLKMGEGAMSQGMQAASRSWKRQGYRLFPRVQKESSPMDSCSDLWDCKIINLCCFKPLSL